MPDESLDGIVASVIDRGHSRVRVHIRVVNAERLGAERGGSRGCKQEQVMKLIWARPPTFKAHFNPPSRRRPWRFAREKEATTAALLSPRPKDRWTHTPLKHRTGWLLGNRKGPGGPDHHGHCCGSGGQPVRVRRRVRARAHFGREPCMILLADGHGMGEERLQRVALGQCVSLDVMVHISG